MEGLMVEGRPSRKVGGSADMPKVIMAMRSGSASGRGGEWGEVGRWGMTNNQIFGNSSPLHGH